MLCSRFDDGLNEGLVLYINGLKIVLCILIIVSIKWINNDYVVLVCSIHVDSDSNG